MFGLENISTCRFSCCSIFFDNNGLICGFEYRLISFSNASFFGLINSNIQVGIFRGNREIGDTGSKIAKNKQCVVIIIVKE